TGLLLSQSPIRSDYAAIARYTLPSGRPSTLYGSFTISWRVLKPFRAAITNEVPCGPYSGLLNVTMATAIIPRPMTATIARDNGIGTGQPSQVMFGESTCSAIGLSDKWLNTACRIGPTT